MIVRTTAEMTETERDIADTGWRSKRIILADDGIGFSFHETTLSAGTVHEFHYKHHIEAVWLAEGSGVLTNLETGEEHPLGPGSMYLLDGHERHRLAAAEKIRAFCVFNPPVTGREVHDESGAYAPANEEVA